MGTQPFTTRSASPNRRTITSVQRSLGHAVVLVGFVIWVCSSHPAQAQAPHTDDQPASTTQPEQQRADFMADVCSRIAMAAGMWSLPPGFLARLIWQESRFDPNAVSPVGAQGIAQFMPGTARLRRLDDPFDLKFAIPASAHFLFDLRNRFGNLGLAAAAYNAGPGRVQRWRTGATGLPRETQRFVAIITGLPPSAWLADPRPTSDFRLDKDKPFGEACVSLPIRKITPQPQFDSAPWQPWGSHLTADWSPSKAMARYAELQRRYPDVLEGEAPLVLRVINPRFGRAPRYEVRIGAPDRKSAGALCTRLSRIGGACLVLRNRR
jgi:hypothetical protein